MEFDDHEPPQFEVGEEQVEEVVGSPDPERDVTANERQARPEFVKECRHSADESVLELTLDVALIEAQDVEPARGP